MRETDKKIIVLNEVESTNNYANQLILSDEAEEGTAVMTHFQTKGKGQPGNRWESEVGKNMLASIILYPNLLTADRQFLISKITSLALVDFLRRKVENVTIKWPNDIYVGKKKIAGILIENSIKGNCLGSSIVGIGLNLNQEVFLSDAPNPVSLTQLTGNKYDVKRVVEEIIEIFFELYKKLENSRETEINDEYWHLLFQKDEWCDYSKNKKTFKAKIVGIGKFGQLQLQNTQGEISEYMFKEVEYIL